MVRQILQMRRLILFTLAVIFTKSLFSQEQAFSITACPAEDTLRGMNISWATDKAIGKALLEVTKISDSNWKKSIAMDVEGKLCLTYDSIYSKTAKGENYYEDVEINKYAAAVQGLKKNTMYKYRVIADGDTSSTHFFKTGGRKSWNACIISDFHVYSPLYGRTKAAMDMIGKVEEYGKPFEWILHLGDITAWGGSYSFWKNLYTEKPFINYMWAGVNGNHDNMTRTNKGNTNKFFRDAAAYPHNGYGDEMGVCYWFKYGDVLFIMLNNEVMRTPEGLEAAQQWVKEVATTVPAKFKVVCEHYQWFFGETGKSSQYSRWSELFDQLGIDLALGANNHIYVSTHPIYDGKVVEPGKGTVYIQTTSSDNERGVEVDLDKPLEHNAEKIKFRWSEGGQTVSAMYMSVTKKKMVLTLIDRHGKVLDVTEIKAAR